MLKNMIYYFFFYHIDNKPSLSYFARCYKEFRCKWEKKIMKERSYLFYSLTKVQEKWL